jgi:catechol 2,3-dioxygenase-like lactoylglutathione lyase family enzyme
MPVLHVSLPTGRKNYQAMRDFYVTVLAPLGYGIYFENAPTFLGMGPKNGNPDFWLHCGDEEFEAFGGDLEKRGGKTHVAFVANSRKAVNEWHALAV